MSHPDGTDSMDGNVVTFPGTSPAWVEIATRSSKNTFFNSAKVATEFLLFVCC